MAYASGFYASQALVRGQPPEIVAQRVNEGLAIGFLGMSPVSAFADYHRGVELKRFVADPRSALMAGTLIALVAAVAILVFRAPAWVLVPIMIAGLTAYAELNSWANRRLGRWR